MLSIDSGTSYTTVCVVPRGVADLYPVAPVAFQVILEPGIDQFRELESPRVHTRMHSWELFLVLKLTCTKRESVS